MTLEFTSNGLTIQTYQEIYDGLVVDYQTIYGADINTDADSPDGQRIGIEAKARLDIQAFILALYNQLDPDLSAGDMLDTIIKWAGITRRPAARSQVDVTITTDRDLDLPDGYAVDDDLGQTWITTAVVPTTAGANAVTLVAEEFGAIAADAGTVTEPATIIIGVISVTNAAAATVGVDEETDPELRIRRNKSLQNPSTSTTGGLFSALGNLAGVTDLIVYENDDDVFDSVLSMVHNSIWCVVEGGTIADIVETMAKNKTGGTSIKGAVTGTYAETVTRPDESTFIINHDMAFDRPVDTPLYITLTVEGVDGATVDVAAIKAALVARSFTIAEDAVASNLYDTVYSVGSNFTATLLKISDDDAVFIDGRIEPTPDGKFSIDTADIDITDIT